MHVPSSTGHRNLVVWQKIFERYRRVILSSSMIAVRGRVQREGEVVHLVAHRIVDLSRDLASVGQREAACADQQCSEAEGIRVKARDFR